MNPYLEDPERVKEVKRFIDRIVPPPEKTTTSVILLHLLWQLPVVCIVVAVEAAGFIAGFFAAKFKSGYHLGSLFSTGLLTRR